MKNVLNKLICTILFTILIFSCSENESHEFSHNEDINTWVKENKKEILNYNRADIKEFSIEKQRAILVALPKDKKKKIWQEKVDYMLNYDLPKEEKKFIEWFGLAFEKVNYEKPMSQNFSDELYEKVMVGAKKFNWSSKFIYLMFFTIDDADTDKNQTNSNTNKKMSGEPDNCTCYYDAGCSGWNNTCHEPDSCTYGNNNCGVFGSTSCDGYCTGDITHN